MSETDGAWRKTVPDNVAFGPDVEPDQREFAGDASWPSMTAPTPEQMRALSARLDRDVFAVDARIAPLGVDVDSSVPHMRVMREARDALSAAADRIAYLESALESHKLAAIRFSYPLPGFAATQGDSAMPDALNRYVAAGGSPAQLDGISRMLTTGRVHHRDVHVLRAIRAASDVGHVGWGATDD